MKKTYLLLAVLITCLQTSFAQLIWHPNLGRAPSGSEIIEWDVTSYMILAEYGDEFSYGDAWDTMEEQLLEAGIRWVRIMSIENPADGTYEIWLDVEPNAGNSERSVIFGTSSSHLLITQKPRFGNIQVELPENDKFMICPGMRVNFPIHSTIKIPYRVYRVNPTSSVDDVVMTFQGVGGTYNFSEKLTPGTYYIEYAANKKFTVDYYDAFDYIFDTDEEISYVQADGMIYEIFFDQYYDGNDWRKITQDSDLSFFDSVFEKYNSGQSESWNNHMQLSYGCLTGARSLGCIRVTCPPNISDTPIENESFIQTGTGRTLYFIQDGGGKLLSPTVNYRLDISASMLYAEIERPQVGVQYTLYKDSEIFDEIISDGTAMTMSAPLVENEHYQVFASYSNVSEGLNDYTATSILQHELPAHRNWIYTQTNNGFNTSYDVMYYNGLGYETQRVNINASGDGTSDLIQPIAYDKMGRAAYNYLPYAAKANSGLYVDSAIEKQAAFFKQKYNTDYAYSYDQYEPSVIDRIERSYKPGEVYQGATKRAVEISLKGNDAQQIFRFRVDPTTHELNVQGYYGAEMLSCSIVTNEDGSTTKTYKDSDDRIVSVDTPHSDTERAITYYAYNDFGELAWVVTPNGSDSLSVGSRIQPSGSFAQRHCYIYLRDNRGRILEKRMPGQEPIYYVYDLKDRIVMQQDGNMRENNQWIIYHYDKFDHVIYQKLVTDTSSVAPQQQREELQAAFIAKNPPAIYTGSSILLHEYIYDSYIPAQNAGIGFKHIADLTSVDNSIVLDMRVRGLLTYERLAILTVDGIDGYLERALYYDYRGRIIQQVETIDSKNIFRRTNKYDFAGNLIAQCETYTHDNTEDNLRRTFSYDSRNRMIEETARFNDGEQALVTYIYDDLGQLTGKTYGKGLHAIHETMDYNLQGWLTRKNSELFDMKLRYYDPEPYFEGEAYYTGNISEWWWQHKNVNGNYDADNNTYIFHYDDLARLNDSRLTYSESEDVANEFVERDITYDKNSNILTLNRSSLSPEDDRTYEFSYSGNQRNKELVEGRGYRYDANGNMTQDGTNYFVVSYNLINLPSWMDTYADYTNIYDYLMDGTKIRHEVWDGSDYHYRGSLVYNNGQFESASFGGGRIVGTDNGANSEVHYFLTDHLGSTRVVAKVTPTDREDLDRKDYYPFGKAWRQPDMPTSENRYLFSGKERSNICLEDDYSSILPIYDFGARFYDPDGVTFLQQDPLMHKYYPIGQYVYCAENPIRFIDSDGRKIRENSRHLKPHMQRILNRTPTGRIQYNKMANNTSDISVRRVEGYYVNEKGVVDRNRMGNASLTAIMKNPETEEIIGGKIDITLYMEAIKDDAKKRGMRVDDREAATLAEEIEHTEAENIQLQIEEREREDKEKQKTGAEVEIPYEKKESEQKAHIFRDRVLRESEVEP